MKKKLIIAMAITAVLSSVSVAPVPANANTVKNVTTVSERATNDERTEFYKPTRYTAGTIRFASLPKKMISDKKYVIKTYGKDQVTFSEQVSLKSLSNQMNKEHIQSLSIYSEEDMINIMVKKKDGKIIPAVNLTAKDLEKAKIILTLADTPDKVAEDHIFFNFKLDDHHHRIATTFMIDTSNE